MANSKVATHHHHLSETDRFLLDLLSQFCVKARCSNWENSSHDNDIEAVGLLNRLSQELSHREYRSLMSAWSDVRLTGSDTTLLQAEEAITQRIQGQSEAF